MEEEETQVLSEYSLNANGMPINVIIVKGQDYVPNYNITIPGMSDPTRLLLFSMRGELISMVQVDMTKIQDKKYINEINRRYIESSSLLIDKYLPGTPPDVKNLLIAYVINMMLGLGELEAPLADDNLEEIAVNGSVNFIWVFHKDFGWCKTNVRPANEEMIYDQAERVGRRVGREINNLAPLMDAVLSDGSRMNATLYPVSQVGNTITIRKFAKNPWTMPAMIKNGTLSPEIGALIWLCIQNEISLLISGGTASGKTSILNASSIFFPPNRRIVSVEETRELTMPEFLQWVPMTTRAPNPEGKGEVNLYELTINALRQRPDIIVVGEIRVQKDAETLFEAIHTGHAVYGTVHADNAQDTIIRLTNPPISLPKILVNAIGGVVTAFRHRSKGIRRILEMGEILRSGDVGIIYKWNPRSDAFPQIGDMTRLADTLSLYSGYTLKEIGDDIVEKASILKWMVGKDITGVEEAGKVVADYYRDRNKLLDSISGDSGT